MKYITLTPSTARLLKSLHRGGFDRITRDNRLEVTDTIHAQIRRLTPIGQTLDETVRRLATTDMRKSPNGQTF